MFGVALRSALAIVALGACASVAIAADIKTVKITQIVEHPALDSTRRGIVDELGAQGFKEGQNLKIEYQSAQGDVGTAGQIAQKFVGDNPDVIVPISTPSAQAVVAAAKGRLPVVFTAVTDPVAAKLVSDPKKPGANVTGISDLSPLDKHLALIRSAAPKAKTIGVPFNPGEANAVVLVKRLKELAPAAGLSIVEAPAPSSGDVLASARSLVGKVDAIYVPTDNTVVQALEAVLKTGIEAKIPVFAGDTDSVKRGAVAAIGFDYYDVGRQTGKVVSRVLKGEKPGDIAVEGVSITQLHVNPGAAQKMGLTLPESLIKDAKTVIK